MTTDVETAQKNNQAILKQLNKAAGAMSELDLTHAHLFDETTQQLGSTLVMLADAFREVSQQVDGLQLDRSIVQDYEELADHVAYGQQVTRSIRAKFRRLYDKYLHPDRRTPSASFFS